MLDEYPAVLTVEDIQEILRIGRCSAYELVNSPGFPTKRIGRSIRIPKVALVEWLQNCQSETEAPRLKLVHKKLR